ncbi:hypothetical protein IU487_33675 [Nocardia puris]|uniref:hypothetical protein n=1 Tax=Nocardia puris TaxID=208602 RepID=UPI0018935A29|nr:hypothetical protein [Nocardia puris]MBF6215951.1 hypothetical protein [Nocardia puris]
MVNNRIYLDPLDGAADREIVVGWDPPLGTFFAYVADRGGEWEEDLFLLHIGTRPDEILDPDRIVEAVRPYAAIPDTLTDTLRAQHDAPGASEKSPFIDLVIASMAAADQQEFPDSAPTAELATPPPLDHGHGL